VLLLEVILGGHDAKQLHDLLDAIQVAPYLILE
jgi:hypothetical protein